MKRLITWAIFSAVLSFAGAAEKPNILVIVADDMGFSDLGCYGSKIRTPHLDRLARQGARFANFRVNPMCTVTRTSLLTGHEHSQSDNYTRSLPLPRALEAVDYATSISGKWHQPSHPMDHGFHEFYGFLGGAINNFTGSGNIMRQRSPANLPQDWFSTNAFTDHALASMRKALAADKPFFTYLAFNAPHTPLNVPREWVQKYNGVFDEGWSVLRQKRIANLRQLGLIDSRYQDSPPMAEVRRWDNLPKATQKNEALRMQSYAAIIDNLDQNVGRVLSFLDEQKIANNTLVIFISDNGGDYGNGSIHTDLQIKPWHRNAYPYMANGWAYLKCAPFRFYKSSSFEGGVRVPCIIRWPNGLAHNPGSINHHQTHVSDLYPTFLELAGTSYEPKPPRVPLMGRSLVPLFKDPELPKKTTQHPVLWAFSHTSRGYLDYPWKLNSVNEGPWQLYNLAEDPCETKNLAALNPIKTRELATTWQNFATNQTTMPELWRRPLRDHQHGWGYHRMMISSPFVTSSPLCSADNVPLKTELSFTYRHRLDFRNTQKRTLRLYRVQDPKNPVWTADPSEAHPAQGTTTITFRNLPELEPSTSYFLLADRGWAKCGGKSLPELNDGAFWFRFRTKAR